jgi:hypothetical protein
MCPSLSDFGDRARLPSRRGLEAPAQATRLPAGQSRPQPAPGAPSVEQGRDEACARPGTLSRLYHRFGAKALKRPSHLTELSCVHGEPESTVINRGLDLKRARGLHAIILDDVEYDPDTEVCQGYPVATIFGFPEPFNAGLYLTVVTDPLPTRGQRGFGQTLRMLRGRTAPQAQAAYRSIAPRGCPRAAAAFRRAAPVEAPPPACPRLAFTIP